MPVFPKNPYPTTSTSQTNTFTAALGERYRTALRTRPFLLFGLPFIFVMVSGSFFLTPATAVRYERFDRKTHMLDRNEAMGLGRVREAGKTRAKGGGRGDIREEYWRLAGRGKELDEWENKRVERLPGEPDGTFE